ncbi:MAG TPA: hypothetical protein VNS79_00565 [Sphingobium sp.]|nr:hypothetical protein [Sphingobium sp.]
MRKLGSIGVLALMLAGCAAMVPVSPAAGPHEATVQYDETAYLGPLQVTPRDMVEDSRCPEGVECIRAGQVKLKVALVEGGQHSERVLTMNEPLMTGAGALTLVATRPYPSITAKYAKSAYRFTVRLERSAMHPDDPGHMKDR